MAVRSLDDVAQYVARRKDALDAASAQREARLERAATDTYQAYKHFEGALAAELVVRLEEYALAHQDGWESHAISSYGLALTTWAEGSPHVWKLALPAAIWHRSYTYLMDDILFGATVERINARLKSKSMYLEWTKHANGAVLYVKHA